VQSLACLFRLVRAEKNEESESNVAAGFSRSVRLRFASSNLTDRLYLFTSFLRVWDCRYALKGSLKRLDVFRTWNHYSSTTVSSRYSLDCLGEFIFIICKQQDCDIEGFDFRLHVHEFLLFPM
jgi:hypothetical protein